MSEIISIEGLSKKFTIGHEQNEQYTALRDVMAKKAKQLLHLGRKERSSYTTEDFWALKDLSFSINQGDRVGIIGRNGAGKSTLLKILSRITQPTTGRIKIRGRVASLLEVGTGFHPELTGRENIFLNGAILGMSKVEIRKKFDEIVTFAEVEKFLDTPVKRYSSGMYVRLAFAVAAHLEPEVLIVDEVLAVGDAQFQKKCLGKMEEVSQSMGRTVLFVSHNMGAIKTLCNKAVILNQGKLILQGDVFDCLSQYYAYTESEINNQNSFVRTGTLSSSKMYVSKLSMIDDVKSEDFRLELKMQIVSEVETRIGINIRLKDGMGFPVGYGSSMQEVPELIKVAEGTNELHIRTLPLKLASGSYKISVELVIPGVEYLDKVEDCLTFELSTDSVSKRKYWVNQNWGYGSIDIALDKVQVLAGLG